MRVHKDGFIQCRTITVSLPKESYRRAISSYRYRNEGIEAEVEKYYGFELSGTERFRSLGQINKYDVLIQIDSDWVQPTRS